MQRIKIWTTLLAVAVLAVSASAVTIESSEYGQVFDSGGFETQTAGNYPTPNGQNSQFPTTNGDGFYWDNVNTSAPKGTVQTSPISAYEGSKYVTLTDNAGTDHAGDAYLTATMDNGGTTYVAQATGTVTGKLAMYIDAGAKPAISWNHWAGDWSNGWNYAASWVSLVPVDDLNPGNGYKARYFNGSWNDVYTGGGTTLMTFDPDEWLEIETTLDMGDNDPANATHTITINGVQSDALPRWGTYKVGEDVNFLQIRSYYGADGTTFYVDAIPEPATMGLLGAGAVGLLLRRRSRKA